MYENSICVTQLALKHKHGLNRINRKKNPVLNYARDTATLINLIILGLMLAYIFPAVLFEIAILSID